MSLLGSLHTLGRLEWLLVLRFTRRLELDRISLLPRTGGETVWYACRGFGGLGDGIGISDALGLRRRHRSSILSIHFFNFAVGDEAAAVAANALRPPRCAGDSERERRLSSMSAARWLLVNTSRSSAGDMKYAKGFSSMLSSRKKALGFRKGGQEWRFLRVRMRNGLERWFGEAVFRSLEMEIEWDGNERR